MDEERVTDTVQEEVSIHWLRGEDGISWRISGPVQTMDEMLVVLKDELGLELTEEGLSQLSSQLEVLEDGQSGEGTVDIGFIVTDADAEVVLDEQTPSQEASSMKTENFDLEVLDGGIIKWKCNSKTAKYKELIKFINEATGFDLTDVGAHAIQNEFEIAQVIKDFDLEGYVSPKYLKDGISNKDAKEVVKDETK